MKSPVVDADREHAAEVRGTGAELAPIARVLLKPSEAAAALGISERMLWTLTNLGEIQYVRISRKGTGGLVRYPPAALTAYVEKKLAGPPPERQPRKRRQVGAAAD